MAGFELHERLAADTFELGRFPLSRLLLMNDSSYPWCILVPQRPDIREIYELAEQDRRALLDESCLLGRALMRLFDGDKLNVAALGNMIPQLHLHHIVRHQDDPAWPGPVWGRRPAVPYDSGQRDETIARIRDALGAVLAAG